MNLPPPNLLTLPRSLMHLAPVLAVTFATTSCDRKEADTPAPPPRIVKVNKLQDGGLEKVVEFPGQIAAVQQSRKAFDVPGRITEMLVKEGETITRGQILAQLDQRDYKSELESAEAHLKMAVTHVERLTPLVEKRAVAQEQIDLARRDLITAQSLHARAQKALEETTLRADFDGQVAELLVKDYANVQAKQVVMVIQDVSTLEIVIQVPETIVALQVPGATDTEKVANAKPVVIPSALPDHAFKARFSEVTRTPDPITRTYRLTLAFDPPADTRVRAGMTAKVRATVPANPGLQTTGYPVPATAVFSDKDGQPQLWKLDPESLTVSLTKVTLGAVLGKQILVTGKLSNDDLVVTSGVHLLREGQSVRIWKQL